MQLLGVMRDCLFFEFAFAPVMSAMGGERTADIAGTGRKKNVGPRAVVGGKQSFAEVRFGAEEEDGVCGASESSRLV